MKKSNLKNKDKDPLSNENKSDLFENPQNGLPEFLKKNNIRDKFGRKMDHPEYDATTLTIPQDYIKKATPAMQQYWNFKADNFDKVLFFKNYSSSASLRSDSSTRSKISASTC